MSQRFMKFGNKRENGFHTFLLLHNRSLYSQVNLLGINSFLEEHHADSGFGPGGGGGQDYITIAIFNAEHPLLKIIDKEFE